MDKNRRDRIAYQTEYYLRTGLIIPNWHSLSIADVIEMTNNDSRARRTRLDRIKEISQTKMRVAMLGKDGIKRKDLREGVIMNLEVFFWEEGYEQACP